MVALHAAAVETKGAAILLLGNSGAGKSTTTAALSALPDWRLLCDDATVLQGSAPTMVGSTATRVCVWQKSLDGLGLDFTRCEPMPAYDGKFNFDPPGSKATEPVPLGAFVFLARRDGLDVPTLTPLSRLEGMATATRQLVLFDPAPLGSKEHVEALARLAAIASTTKMVRLSYPSRFDALPAVADLLAELASA